MEDIKPKKERKFLKAVGKVAGILLQEFVLGLGRKFIGKKIDRIGNKRQALLIFLALFCNIAFASVDSIPYPITGNKQRLGWQTTGNGLVYRGRSNDTITKPTNYVDKNVKAYLILDSVRGTIFVWRQTYWDSLLVGGGGGGGLTMPFDSITFNTAKDGTVGVGEVEYNDTQGSLIQGLKGGNVTNVIGQQLHQRVNNRTGAPLAKGDVVYLSGSQGNRITVAKALATSDPTSANTFGIVAESIADNQSGYIITEGLITNLNTSALTQDSAVYLSGTTAGALTSTKPQAPIHGVYIGVCVKSNAASGEIFVKIRNGQELDELHDVQITSPVNNASLYYRSSDGLWRDTTAALLVSDTASMLANYATKAYADTTGRFYARQDFSNVSSSSLTWTQSDTLVPGGVNVVQVYRNGQILLPSQYTIPTSTSVVIASASYKAGENYTVIFPRGGGAGSGGGSGSLTSISAGTGITVSPNPITTTGTVSADLSVLMELTDTVSLSNRINLKLNATDTASLSSRIDAKGIGTVTSVASGYGIAGGTITTTGTLRLDSASVYNYIRDSIVDVQIGNDTIKILKQEYNNVTSDTLTWTITSKFPIQLRAYILLFRNGQLLINDQYSIIDTNKIKVAATSYKLGENYTVVTVSGIGSAGISQTGNPIYPEAGIALSTGTTWTTSIPNNSTNWNTAYTDRLKWDGGSSGLVAATGRTSLGGTTIGQSMFTLTNPSATTFPRFNDDNSITARSAANFRSDIGAGTVSSVTVAAGTPISISNTTTTPTIELLSATSGRNGYLTSTDWTNFNNKQSALGFTPANSTITINTTSPLQGGGDLSTNRTLSILSATENQSGILTTTPQNIGGSKAFKSNIVADSFIYLNNTSPIPTVLLGLNTSSNVNNVGKFSLGAGLSITSGSLLADTNFLVTRYDTASMLTNYLRTGVAASTYLPLTGGTLTGGLSGTSINLSSTINSIGDIFFGSSSSYSGLKTRYFKTTDVSPNRDLFIGSVGTIGTWAGRMHFQTSYNTETPTTAMTINEFGNINMNGTLGVTGATTLSSTLAVTGNITEAGNNVLTNLDTASLSSRIDSKFNSSGGTISGAVTLSTSTATPSSLLGKDGSNVVGTVTTVAQTGLFGRGSVTNVLTNANGEVTITHGLGFTPIMAFANIPGSTVNIVNVKSVNSTDIVVVVRDSDSGAVQNTVTISTIQWFAIK